MFNLLIFLEINGILRASIFLRNCDCALTLSMPIDISLLRESIRTELEIEELLNLLERAIELIPQECLPELIEGFFDPDLLSVNELSEHALLEDVIDFHSDSLTGLYYNDFKVNSKNFHS